MSQAYPNLSDRYEDWNNFSPTRHIHTPDGTIIYISGDVRKYNYHAFAATGAAGHLHVDVTIGGDLWHEVAVKLLDDTTPGSLTKTIRAGEIASLRGKFKGIRVRAYGELIAVGSHGWA